YKNGIWEMARNLEGLDETMRLIVKKSGELKPTFMYEANMTENSYFGRVGQAIVQTDYYASAVERGGAIPNVFHLTGGQWKMVIPSQEYKKTPLYYTTQYYNKFCKGNVLRTELETMATITNSTGEVYSFDPVGCHIYAENNAFSILIFSRDFEHDYKVQVNLPDELQLLAPETAKKYVITGHHFSDRDAVIDSSLITTSDSMLVEVPRYSMVVISFGGDGSEVVTEPMGYYDYVTASSLSIYPYGSDDYVIADRRSKILRADVLPESVFWEGVRWEVETNGVNVDYGVKSYGFEIEGSETCDGNGTIKVWASAWDNPLVRDSVEVTISNQGTDCGTGQEDYKPDQFRIYPNPASETLYMDNFPEWPVNVSVTDLAGRICISQFCSGPVAELDLSAIKSGIYYVNFTVQDKVQVLKFFIE
ncbi:MAG: T9SS type A sorting domain-containing protein, partial [Bacteroidales bacterium]|nr:T9SS type A sorting domain-containing protein [Bacteroidales bacterium]